MDYQELFNYMANNHNVNLLESEMQEVISIVQRMLNNSEATFETPSVNDNEAQKKSCNNCKYYLHAPIEHSCFYCNSYSLWKQDD